MEERLLAKDGSLNNLMDWKYHEWFGTDNHGQKKQIHHGEYIYVDYDGDGHQEMLVRQNTTRGKDIWFHRLEIFDSEKFNAKTTDIDPKNYRENIKLSIDQVRLKNRSNNVGPRYPKRSWIDAIWIKEKMYFIFIQSLDSAMYPYGGSTHHEDYMKPYLMVFSIGSPNENYNTSDIIAHCFMQPKNQVNLKFYHSYH